MGLFWGSVTQMVSIGLEFGEESRWRGQMDSNQVLPRPGETPEVHAGGRDRKGSQAGWVFKETVRSGREA